jgi:hypothetical protein
MAQNLCLDSSIAVLDAAVLVDAAVSNTAVLNAAVFDVPDDAHFALNSIYFTSRHAPRAA